MVPSEADDQRRELSTALDACSANSPRRHRPARSFRHTPSGPTCRHVPLLPPPPLVDVGDGDGLGEGDSLDTGPGEDDGPGFGAPGAEAATRDGGT